MINYEKVKENLITILKQRKLIIREFVTIDNKSVYTEREIKYAVIDILQDEKYKLIVYRNLAYLCHPYMNRNLLNELESDVIRHSLGLYDNLELQAFNDVQKRLGRSYSTCKKAEETGLIKFMNDLLTESEVYNKKESLGVSIDDYVVDIGEIKGYSVVQLITHSEEEIKEFFGVEAQEIIDSVHDLGYLFINERVISKDDIISRLGSIGASACISKLKELLKSCKTIEELLHLNVKDIDFGPIVSNQIIDRVHSLGFKFDDEDELIGEQAQNDEQVLKQERVNSLLVELEKSHKQREELLRYLSLVDAKIATIKDEIKELDEEAINGKKL